MAEPARPPGCDDPAPPEKLSGQTQQAQGSRTDVIDELLRLIAELQLRTAAQHRKLEELQTLLLTPRPKPK